MIRYDRLWQTMKEKGFTKSRLVGKYGVSPSLITKLKRNESITIHTVNSLCTILDCQVEDIMEYLPDASVEETEETAEGMPSPNGEAEAEAEAGGASVSPRD